MKNEAPERQLCVPSRVVRFALEREDDSMSIMMTLRPVEANGAHEVHLRFTGVSDLRFRGERTELTEIVSLLVRDVSQNGLEGTRFRVRDYEEDFISFGCHAVDVVAES